MGSSKRRLILIFLVILSPLLIGQNLSDKPIVVKDEIETKIKIEMIDTDNLQRILEDMNDRIKTLEKEVKDLKERIDDAEGR